MTRRPTALVLSACLAGALPLAAASAAHAAPPAEPFVAEIHDDDTGADAGESVEVQLPPGTTSDGWSVVRYNGSGGAPYGTDALPALTAPADASAVALLGYPANGLQNGSPDGLALVRPDGSVAELLSYEGVFTTQVLGPDVEELAREWTIAYASTETLGGFPQRVASSVVADPRRRTQHEVDVVAVRCDGERAGDIVLVDLERLYRGE